MFISASSPVAHSKVDDRNLKKKKITKNGTPRSRSLTRLFFHGSGVECLTRTWLIVVSNGMIKRIWFVVLCEKIVLFYFLARDDEEYLVCAACAGSRL